MANKKCHAEDANGALVPTVTMIHCVAPRCAIMAGAVDAAAIGLQSLNPLFIIIALYWLSLVVAVPAGTVAFEAFEFSSCNVECSRPIKGSNRLCSLGLNCLRLLPNQAVYGRAR